MANPTSLKNSDLFDLDTLYAADGTPALKLAVAPATVGGLTPAVASEGVATHQAGGAVGAGDGVVVMAGVNPSGSLATPLAVDGSGNLTASLTGTMAVEGLGTAGTPTGGVLTLQGDPSGTPMPVSLSADSAGLATETTLAQNTRQPSVFKPFSGLVITTETAVWTPPGGQAVHWLGFVVTQGVLTGDITVRDGLAGTTILVIPATPTGQPLAFPLGSIGITLGTNNALTFQGSATETVSGFLYGWEG
jgi:hypothetical protein